MNDTITISGIVLQNRVVDLLEDIEINIDLAKDAKAEGVL